MPDVTLTVTRLAQAVKERRVWQQQEFAICNGGVSLFSNLVAATPPGPRFGSGTLPGTSRIR